MATFHNRVGSLVVLSNDRRTAQRRRETEEFADGIVFSSKPLRNGQLFEVQIDRKLANGWTGSVEIGVTALDPDSLNLPHSLSEITENTWVLSGSSVNHDGDTTIKEYGVDLDGLKEGDCVGVLRTASGELHFYVNGADQGRAAVDIPSTVHAAVDILGQCAQVSIVRDSTVEADEIVEKLQFHPRCGSKAEVTNGQSTALRPNPNDDFTDGVVLTNRILRNGEHFEVELDETVDIWTGSLEIGVTTHAPFTLNFPSTMTELSSGTWMLTGDGVNHNGIVVTEYCGQRLDDLTRGDRVGVVRKEDKTVHFTINGVDQGEAATNVPAAIYGVVDLFAKAAQVTIVDHSEMLFKNRYAYLNHYAAQPIELPVNWKSLKSLDDETVKITPVQKDVADAIKRLVELTWDYDNVGQGRDARNLKHSRIEVTKVEQIESTRLYKEYERQRKAFCERAAKKTFPKVTRDHGEADVVTSVHMISLLDDQLIPEINEHFLFHGAKSEFIDAILKQGIDFRLANAGMFGKGAYFCEMSTKADQYTDSMDGRTSGDHFMILTKVILGHSYIAKQSNNDLLRPPCVYDCSGKCKHAKSEFYDSVMGTHGIVKRRLLFREFILFEEKQCYPAYLITYVRK